MSITRCGSSMGVLASGLFSLGLAQGCLSGDGPSVASATGDKGTGESGGEHAGVEEGTQGDTMSDAGQQSAITIYDLQQGNVPEGTVVTIHDVVVTSEVLVDKGVVFVQEAQGGPYSGIQLYLYADVAMGVELHEGDVVDVTAEYVEYFDYSELTVRGAEDLVVTGHVDPLAPALVSSSDIATGGTKSEEYEGVLVKVHNAVVSDPNLGHGDFEVDGGLVIDDLFLFALQLSPHPAGGASFDAIVGPLMYSYEEFRLTPRKPDDLVGPANLGAQEVTIYELQSGDITEGAEVVVRDVIITTPLTSAGDTFFVEDGDGGEFSGIAVYVYEPAGLMVSPGERVNLAGQYQEYYGQSQIVIGSAEDMESLGAGQLPAPVVVAAADVATGGTAQESHEGVLVRIENTTVTEAANQHGQWQLDGGLWVDDIFIAQGWPAMETGTELSSITGVMGYGYDQAFLAPTRLQDIVEAK